MKLWLKSFLSLFFVSFCVLTISLFFIIEISFSNSIKREAGRSISVFELFIISMENSLPGNTIDQYKTVVERYNNYYNQKGISFLLLENNEVIKCGLPKLEKQYSEYLSSDSQPKKININIDNEYFSEPQSILLGDINWLQLTLSVSEQISLVYLRDISEIYQSRTYNIMIYMLITIISLPIIALMSFIISRQLIRPLKKLQSAADALACGSSTEPIKETNDEVGVLARSFNKMSKAITQRELELEQSINERQTFIDNMSHELNTPLTSIRGYAQLLQNSACTEELRHKAAANISQETHRISSIQQQLMALTRAVEKSFEPLDIDIAQLFSDVAESLRSRVVDNNIILLIDVGAPQVTGDRTMLHIAVANLINNSISYSDKGSEIKLSSWQTENEIILAVFDHGIGIPADKISSVTEPFYRVDKSRSRATGGSGLGLSICKKIADIHSAQLTITSELNIGTTVKLIFPRR